jgi:Protein of unknown function (DUF4230)
MGVVSPERRRTEAPPRPPELPPSAPPPPEPPRRRDVPWGLVGLAVVVILIAAGIGWVRDVFPDFSNPFAEQTVDRSSPPVLQAIRDLGEYRAAAGDYQVIVDLAKDTQLPDELLGERTLFVAVGSVDAGVDLGAVSGEDVRVSQDRRAATIVLPHARLYEAELDVDRSYVYEHDRGLFNRIGSLFGGDSNQEELYRVGERRIGEAARANDELRSRAEANTRTMLASLLRSLGFRETSIRFE